MVGKASCCSNEHKQFRGFLAPNSFGRFFTLNFCLILSRLHCIFCEDIYDHWISVSGAAVYERITDEVLQSLRPGGGRPSQTREARRYRSAILIFIKGSSSRDSYVYFRGQNEKVDWSSDENLCRKHREIVLFIQ